MSPRKILESLEKEKNGIIQTSEAVEAGISKATLYKLLDELDFEKVSHGIYASSNIPRDDMYIISLRSKQAIFSHDTALYLHGLSNNSDKLEKYTVTVKTGYNPTKLTSDGIKVFTIKSDLHKLGLTYMSTKFGNFVPVYNIERTICDIIL